MKLLTIIKSLFKKELKLDIPKGMTSEELCSLYNKIQNETGKAPIVIGDKETMKILSLDVAKKQ